MRFQLTVFLPKGSNGLNAPMRLTAGSEQMAATEGIQKSGVWSLDP